jgi:hypothetical protein
MRTPGKGKRGPKPGAAPAFLARKDAIAAELDRGHKMRTAYETHAPHLGISYSQFTRYVNQHIRKKEIKLRDKPNATAAAGTGASIPPVDLAPRLGADPQHRQGGGPIITPSTERKRFIHDPAAIHTKKLF